ncbi:MAG: isopentenyl-diphosphate Delta-isomerase [Salinibacter sp.]|jgi:isopentenyl-diphosphate delta-isomerase, type 1|uniref:isopentenyl-diphosphate Delta-isomerase n=1 Tax=Salinibacter sp. TaxID=2065818 RepID=UPI002FC2C4F9
MSHPVVLVNEDDRSLGTADKLRAHAEGWLHRAFSVFIFDPEGRLLLQQRTVDKYHSGGLWSNTCCSHPRPGEAPIDGAHRRLPEELGFTASLTPILQDRYDLPVGENLVEHEHNHVFVGSADAPRIYPSAEEVADWRWVSPSVLREDVAAHPHRYTAWFRHLLPPALAAAPSPSGDPSASPSPT